MFRSMPETESTPPVMDPSEQLVALSVIALDLPEPSGVGWAAYLADRGIAIVLDDLGRSAITKAAARQLFTERRENEVRAREVAARQERQAIESDRQFRAQLPHGVPWYEIPDGVLPVVAMTQADRDSQPKRLSPLQEALSGEPMTYHSLHPAPDDE